MTTEIMGVLNVTPDSFSDGGSHLALDDARQRAVEMVEQGASIIDVGGYSSRPGAIDIEPDEEQRRVFPVLEALASDLPGAAISIDTFRPAVARGALERGASIVNDIFGGRDAELRATAREFGAGYVVMHMKGSPQTMQRAPHYDDVLDEVTGFLCQQVAQVRSEGIEQIWCDPGFGFGKSVEHNYLLLAELGRVVHAVSAPVLVGLSRKSMFWRLLDAAPTEVIAATSAAHCWAVVAGASILRVHDVPEARQAVAIAEQLATAANRAAPQNSDLTIDR